MSNINWGLDAQNQGGRPTSKILKRKRPRALQACDVCRIRKNRCSEHRPCTYCVEHDMECTYARSSPGESQRSRLRSDHGDGNVLFNANRALASSKPPAVKHSDNQDSVRESADLDMQHAIVVDGRDGDAARHSNQPAAMGDRIQARPLAATNRDSASDVMDTNLYTNNLEFYGSASSVAFIRHVETLSNSHILGAGTGMPELSLTSMLHNTDFQPSTSRESPAVLRDAATSSDRFHFRLARRFLDAYFSNIHYIQPLLDEDGFLTRCEDLWFNRVGRQSLSFVALYYATLSLGSLVMTLDEPKIAGLDRFEWSCKLFNESIAIVTQLGTATNIEMVQCLYMLSKVCQHELSPHAAYIYSGQAARTALAIGLNRSPVNPDNADPRASLEASQTWWAIYCLEIQTSFALGRPDSLGPDEFHTQHFPSASTDNQNNNPLSILRIVPHMVSLSRIMRQTTLDLYTAPNNLTQKLKKSSALDEQLRLWRANLPLDLWPEHEESLDVSLKPKRSTSFAKKQSVVLRLRYLNLRMVIHAVFMIDPEGAKPEQATPLLEARCRCIQAASDAIDLIYSTFRTDNFFQSWWYNCTYTLYAVSVLLALVFRRLARTALALKNLFKRIDRAIAVLQAMDDCLVARNATTIIKRTLVRARRVPQPGLSQPLPSTQQEAPFVSRCLPASNPTGDGEPNASIPLLETDRDDLSMGNADLDWLAAYPYDTSHQALFWTEWANELDVLGT